jgi:hypothetical protein
MMASGFGFRASANSRGTLRKTWSLKCQLQWNQLRSLLMGSELSLRD